MRVLYAIRSPSHFMNNETIIRCLVERGHEITLLFNKGWIRGDLNLGAFKEAEVFAKENKGVSLGFCVRRKDRWRKLLYGMRALVNYASYLRRPDQSELYTERWKNYLPEWGKKAAEYRAMKGLLALKSFQRILRTAQTMIPTDPMVDKSIRDIRPDVIVASHSNYNESDEAEYLKSGQSMGIPTATVAITWDNMSNKGIIPVVPSLTLVWNRSHVHQAMKIHCLPSKKIVIVGSPLFDKWFEPDKLEMDRVKFCKRVGLNPKRPFLTYLGSHVNIAKDESWIVLELEKHLRSHPRTQLRDMGVLIRPHPANYKPFEGLEMDGFRVWPEAGVVPVGGTELQDYYNSLKHSVAAIGINTTGMISAVIADRPCLSLIADRYAKTQMDTTHFKDLLDWDTLYTATSVEQCVEIVSGFLDGNDAKSGSRHRFVREFARPYGVHVSAGEVSADAIEALVLGKPFQTVRPLDTH